MRFLYVGATLLIFTILFACSPKRTKERVGLSQIAFDSIPYLVSHDNANSLKRWSIAKRQDYLIVRHYLNDSLSPPYLVSNYNDSVIKIKRGNSRLLTVQQIIDSNLGFDTSEVRELSSNILLFTSLDVDDIYWYWEAGILFFNKNNDIIYYFDGDPNKIDSLNPFSKSLKKIVRIRPGWYKKS